MITDNTYKEKKKGKQFNTEGLKWTGLLFIMKIQTANNTPDEKMTIQ
jgi:hypothetical protein